VARQHLEQHKIVAEDLLSERSFVDVWSIDLDAPGDRSAIEVLNEEEIDRSRRFHRWEDGERWANSRRGLRSILAGYLDRDPMDLSFGATSDDKPTIAGALGEELFFNMSHSKGIGLVAVSTAYDVGIDVEAVRSEIDLLGIADRVFAKEVVEELEAMSGQEQLGSFFTRWVRLEASTKCMGPGLIGPDEVLDPDLKVEDLAIERGFAAALAVLDRDATWDSSRLRRFDWSGSI
jgi:4'-phosphopantetheinyl transferase